MRRLWFGLLVLVLCAMPALAHVTPNVTLLRRGDFVKQSFPAATRFFEKSLALDEAQRSAVENSTGWTPTDEEARIYVARDDAGRLVGTATFLWMPSQHGPVGIAVAFDPHGVISRAAVTDVGTEPLAWVRPLLDGDGMSTLQGLSLQQKPDASRIGSEAKGTMSRYYATVLADGVARAQALERVATATAR